jgi:hypothetical protein
VNKKAHAEASSARAVADEPTVCRDNSFPFATFRVRAEAPIALAALGIEHAHLRWQRARAEIRRARAQAELLLDEGFARIRTLIEIQRVFEQRGGGFAPSGDDVKEAVLRLESECDS